MQTGTTIGRGQFQHLQSRSAGSTDKKSRTLVTWSRNRRIVFAGNEVCTHSALKIVHS
jgi:hypothetical protein